MRLLLLAGFGALGLFLLIRGMFSSSVAAVLVGCVLLMITLVLVLSRIRLVRQLNRLELDGPHLAGQTVTYRPVGETVAPEFHAPPGFHAVERRAFLGHGRDTFERAADRIRRWEVKTRAGFRVIRVGDHGSFFSDGPVASMENAVIRFGPVRETVTVVRVVDEPRRRGFAYGTLPRHPLRGEEAFLAEWHDDDRVEFVVRSMSKPRDPSGWLWFPLLLIAQQFFLRRYLRALVE
ncbi:MAG: DUF1990 domain-containing protein [Pseudolysinimonas sp.]